MQKNLKNQKFSKLCIEFLGTGGATSIPKPLCDCRICSEAKAKQIPYSRSGPSIFIHGPNVLIDTPEEIKDQIVRSRIKRINACLYSHWHPDHTLGRRVWELINYDFKSYPPRHKITSIFLPQQVYEDFHEKLGTWEHLRYFSKLGIIKILKMDDGKYVNVCGIRIKPIRLGNNHAYAFLLKWKNKKLLVVHDELTEDFSYKSLRGLDLAILPMGIPEFNPLTGKRSMPRNHPLLKSEMSYNGMMEISRKLKAKRVIITHIEEIYGLSYKDYLLLEKRFSKNGLKIKFAFDSMIIRL